MALMSIEYPDEAVMDGYDPTAVDVESNRLAIQVWPSTDASSVSAAAVQASGEMKPVMVRSLQSMVVDTLEPDGMVAVDTVSLSIIVLLLTDFMALSILDQTLAGMRKKAPLKGLVLEHCSSVKWIDLVALSARNPSVPIFFALRFAAQSFGQYQHRSYQGLRRLTRL